MTKKIVHTGPKPEQIDPADVARELGAEPYPPDHPRLRFLQRLARHLLPRSRG